jgi:hypothetical protein
MLFRETDFYCEIVGTFTLREQNPELRMSKQAVSSALKRVQLTKWSASVAHRTVPYVSNTLRHMSTVKSPRQ